MTNLAATSDLACACSAKTRLTSRRPLGAHPRIGAKHRYLQRRLRHTFLLHALPHPDQLVIVWSKVNGNRNASQPATFGLEAAEYCLPVSLCWTGGNYSLSPPTIRNDPDPADHSRFNNMVGTPFFPRADILQRKESWAGIASGDDIPTLGGAFGSDRDSSASPSL